MAFGPGAAGCRTGSLVKPNPDAGDNGGDIAKLGENFLLKWRLP